MISPKYSICVCNYNMADTLDRALTSVLNQLDDRFEVVVVDDGSSDSSLKILRNLESRFSRLRIIALRRDPERLLGITRNICVQAARGRFVLQHIDADDEWEPFLKDFVEVFHKLEHAAGKKIFLQGQQVNIASRDLLLEHGPYRNIYRGEDRDLWQRMAIDERFFLLLHRPFRTRLSRPKSVKFKKAIWDTWSHISHDVRQASDRPRFLLETFRHVTSKNANIRLRSRVLRAFMAPAAWWAVRRLTPLSLGRPGYSWADFSAYRDRRSGTIEQLLVAAGAQPDINFLSPEARKIFTVPGGRP